MHPTCTELGSWHPADTQSAVALHLNVCSRCRGLQARLEIERAELDRLLPITRFLEQVASFQPGVAIDTERRGRSSLERDQTTLVGADDFWGEASTEARGGLLASVRNATTQLQFDRESGLVWMRLPGGHLMALGDLRELRAYLEGAWLEAWSAAGASGSRSEFTERLDCDVDAVIQYLWPRLERIGWHQADRSAAESPAGNSRTPKPASWLQRTWRAAVIAASLVVGGLVVRAGVESRERASDIESTWKPSLPTSSALVAKGTLGLPELVVLVKRGPILLEYDDTATVMSGDRLRLRFRQHAPGPVLAGIWTEAGEWVPFFEAPFGIGEHSPTATLSVDDRPGSGRVLLGTPTAVRALMSGSPSSDVSVIRVAWAPPSAGGR